MKISIKHYVLLCIVAIAWSGVHAQDEPMSFSLAEATQFAMKNSYVLQNTSRDITIAQKKVWETISTGLPQVTGNFDYTDNITAAKSPFPVGIIPKEFWPELGIPGDTPPDATIPISFMQKFNSNFGVNVTQQIFDGSWIVGVSSAELYVNLSKQAHEKTEIDIRDAVSRAYYLVLISERYQQVMEENLANTQQLFEETKVYFENGFREEQDVDQLTILLGNAKNEVLRAARELSVAKTVLKYTMGYELDFEITLSDQLELYINPLITTDKVVNFDLNNHIDFRLAQSNFQVSEKLLKLEKSTYLPRLNAFFNYTKTTFGDNANVFKDEWYPSTMLGLQASIPIFNSGNKRAKVQQATIEMDKAANDRMLTQITLQKDFLTASAQYETAVERFRNDQNSRDLAKRILDKTQIKFNEGMVSSVELSQQETQYINAFQALVASTMSLLEADLNLKKAAGAL